MKTRLVPFLLTFCLLAACGRNQGGTVSSEETYSAAHLREVGAGDYHAAMDLVTEGLKKQEITAFRANMLYANLTYQFTPDK